MYIKALLIASIVIFPFIDNKMAMQLPENYELNDNQKHLKEVSIWLETNNYASRSMYTNAYFIPFQLNKRIGYNDELIEMKELQKSNPKKGAIIAWDSYFAMTDSEVSKEYIDSTFDVTLLKTFIGSDDYTVIIYEVN